MFVFFILCSIAPTLAVAVTAGTLDAGGTVVIPAGVYDIVRSILLRSNVRLRGDGRTTVIRRRNPLVQVALARPGKRGDRSIVVADLQGIRAGDEVCINTNRKMGWKTIHAIVVAIEGNEIRLDRPLFIDYALQENPYAMNLFPAIYASNAENISIEALSIDGGWTDEPIVRRDFTLSAVHFNNVRDSVISRVWVKRYPADGISVQRGDNVSVSGCVAEHNFGHGFHPGTKLTNGNWTNNVGRFDHGDGFFFCQNVRYLNVGGNRLRDNRGHGIGNLGLGGEGDRYNVVAANFCYHNGRSGIEARAGGHNIVSNNICENNSQSEPNRWPGILVQETHSTIIAGNRCLDSQAQGEKTQAVGILVRRGSANNMITGNVMSGHLRAGIDGDTLAGNIVKDNISVAEHVTNQPAAPPPQRTGGVASN